MLSYLSLLLAVTSAVQQAVPAPTPKPRAHRRAHVATTITTFVAPVAALEAGAQTLAAAQPDLQAFTVQAPVLAMAARDLEMAAYSLAAAPVAFAAPAFFWDGADEEDVSEPDWPDQTQADVADSLYRAARQALNQSQYEKAADLFSSVRNKYPRSTYVPDTYYWQAFALYRAGSDDNLRAARSALQTQASQYPKASSRRDAAVLLRRVQGALARSGDAAAAEDITSDADQAAGESSDEAREQGREAREQGREAREQAREARESRGSRRSDRDCDDDDDLRIAALNAVLQMDPDRAVPLLKTVLARRDEGSACLRRKAVFLLSQKRTSETSGLLLNAVRSDPDQEVREQAVFWLSQVPGDETVAALDSILRDPKTPPDIQDKAIFALSQHNSSRSASILRAYAERRDAPAEMREKAIFWLGQRRSPENAQFLKDLYAKMDNDDLKEKIIFSLSQMGGADNYRWLMDIALNPKEDIEIRKKALFWAGQGHNVDVADLVKLYDSMTDREMREQLIFVYSQRREDAALDKLFQIGKNDPDRELRKKAIFWIGQSRSPRAAQYLQELINQ